MNIHKKGSTQDERYRGCDDETKEGSLEWGKREREREMYI